MSFSNKKKVIQSCVNKIAWLTLLIIWIAVLAYRPAFWTVVGAVSCLGVLIGFIFLISGKRRFTFLTVSVLMILLWIVNNIKRVFWKERLFFDDLTVMTDPENFGTVFHYPVPAILIVVFIVLALWCIARTFRQEKTKSAWTYRCCLGIALIAVGLWGGSNAVDKGQTAWLQTLPKGSNIVSNLLMSAQVGYKSPATVMSSNYSFPTEPKINPTVGALPDVVVVLQESTMNPMMYRGLDYSSLPKLEMFESPYATEQGTLRVHTYGGGTWRSEFSVLTGLSSDDFAPLAGSVFYSAVFHVNDSLFRRLKAAGYKIVVVSPFVEGAYNSGTAYRTLGADEILHPIDLGYPCETRKNLWKIRTEDILSLVKKVMDQYEGPLAVYTLTMQEHGPYPESEVVTPRLKGEPSHSVGKNELLNLESYVQRLEDASAAVVQFDRWIKNREKPTVMVRFGDHQPALKWKQGYVSKEKKPDYLTNFALVDNRSNEHIVKSEMTDIVFLPGMVLDRLPIEKGEFFETNTRMRILCHGRYLDCSDENLIKGYQNEIFVRQRIAN